MARFDGKSVIVTGGARGIGRALAEWFLSNGAKVAIWDRQGAAEAAAEVNAPALIALSVDVTDADRVAAALEETLGVFGHVDILINNAAVHRHDNFLEMDPASWDEIVGTNTRAVVMPTQAVARYWQRSGIKGAIVNVTSTDSHLHFRRTTHYCASKAAASSFGKSAALALAPYGIRVNEVAPGFVNAGMAKRFIGGPEAPARLKAMVPLARAAEPEEIAKAVAFLASDDAAYITGARLEVDGGFSIAGLDALHEQLLGD
jgi:NAD(P)-dependent dehydrogenase (short-subunit alcohol dehydrogenase family)